MRTLRIALLALAVCMASGVMAQAITWDASADFTTSVNPNGAWEYGYVATTGFYTPFTTGQVVDLGGVTAWYTGDPANTSIIAKNTNATPWTDGYSYLEVGQVLLHGSPGGAGQPGVIHWASPITGTISLTGMFTGQSYNPVTTDARVVILKNSTTLALDAQVTGFYGTAANNYADRSGTNPFVTFSDTWDVTVGDYYDFVVIPTLRDPYGPGFQGCGFSATITQVPEPCTMLVLAGGLGALIMRRRRS